jgi:hypothetical protein
VTVLVPKLLLRNVRAVEAPASSERKLELPEIIGFPSWSLGTRLMGKKGFDNRGPFIV